MQGTAAWIYPPCSLPTLPPRIGSTWLEPSLHCAPWRLAVLGQRRLSFLACWRFCDSPRGDGTRAVCASAWPSHARYPTWQNSSWENIHIVSRNSSQLASCRVHSGRGTAYRTDLTRSFGPAASPSHTRKKIGSEDLRQEFPLTEASISRNGFQPMTPLFLEMFLDISEISRLNGSADLSPQRKKSKNQE